MGKTARPADCFFKGAEACILFFRVAEDHKNLGLYAPIFTNLKAARADGVDALAALALFSLVHLLVPLSDRCHKLLFV